MPALKYAAGLSVCGDCAPPTTPPRTGDSFRWVFDPMTAGDFEPIAAKDPGRLAHASSCHDRIELWGVSLFASEQAARKRWNNLINKSPFLKKKLGTHVARGNITGTGVADPPSTSGHFDLFEYAGVALFPLFTVVGPL